MLYIFILLIFANASLMVKACPSQPPPPTTTPDPQANFTINAPFSIKWYEPANRLRHKNYAHCPSYFVGCSITEMKWDVLKTNSHIHIYLPGGRFAGLKRWRIHKLGDSYMVYYLVDDYEKYYDEAVFMYDSKTMRMRAAISWHEANDRYFRFIIWMPEPGVTVISETGPTISTLAPGVSFTASGGNYGFRTTDDAMTWFYRSTQNMPEKYVQLFDKGRRDNDTVVTITVAIKYTVEFARTLAIFQKHGLYFLTAYTLRVLDETFLHSRTKIKFKLRCVSHVLVANDNVETGDDDLKLETVLGHKSDYEALMRDAYGENWRNVSGRMFMEPRIDPTPTDPTGHEARHSADLVIAYVHEMNSGTGKSYPYQMHLGKTGVMIRFDGMFDYRLLAHQVGHILGAGHYENDESIISQRMYYAKGMATENNLCTVMANGRFCRFVPYYSNPNIRLNEEQLLPAWSGAFGSTPPKPDEWTLGVPEARDNSRWIKENRFILASVGNETIPCRGNIWTINPKVVNCLNMGADGVDIGGDPGNVFYCDNIFRPYNQVINDPEG